MFKVQSPRFWVSVALGLVFVLRFDPRADDGAYIERFHDSFRLCFHAGSDHHPNKGLANMFGSEKRLTVEAENIVRFDMGFDLTEIGFAVGGEQIELDVGRDSEDFAFRVLQDETLGTGQSFADKFFYYAANKVFEAVTEAPRESREVKPLCSEFSDDDLEPLVHFLAEVDEPLVHGLEAADGLLRKSVEVLAECPDFGDFVPGRKDVLESVLNLPPQGWVFPKNLRELNPQAPAEVAV